MIMIMIMGIATNLYAWIINKKSAELLEELTVDSSKLICYNYNYAIQYLQCATCNLQTIFSIIIVKEQTYDYRSHSN